jgi:type II secretory pathway pseudopilin PulG
MIEMLVVVLIIGITVAIGGASISKAWKRQKLESAANDVRVIFQRAFPEMQRRNMVTFVQVGPIAASGKFLPIFLVGDANGNGALDLFAKAPTVANPDLLIDEYDIVVTPGTSGVGQEFTLSDAGTNLVSSTLWSNNATAWTAPRVLMCDFQGRAIDVASGRQIVAPATLVFTHTDVVNGYFTPPTRFVLTINPVWSIRMIRQINSSYTRPYAAATWVNQNG